VPPVPLPLPVALPEPVVPDPVVPVPLLPAPVPELDSPVWLFAPVPTPPFPVDPDWFSIFVVSGMVEPVPLPPPLLVPSELLPVLTVPFAGLSVVLVLLLPELQAATDKSSTPAKRTFFIIIFLIKNVTCASVLFSIILPLLFSQTTMSALHPGNQKISALLKRLFYVFLQNIFHFFSQLLIKKMAFQQGIYNNWVYNSINFYVYICICLFCYSTVIF